MRCVYCESHVVGRQDIVVVSGQGPAHDDCFQQSLVDLSKRQFTGLDLANLNEAALIELNDLVAMEINSRFQKESDRVELF